LFVKVGPCSNIRAGSRIKDDTCRQFVFSKELPQAKGFLLLARQGYGIQLYLKGLFEKGDVLFDKPGPLISMAKEHKEQSAVYALQGLLHLLTGNNTPEVLPEDDIYRLSEVSEPYDALQTNDKDDEEKSPETQEQLMANL
jgi:hypothetical protein